MLLTFRAQPRAGCEAGHIHNLHGKLLPRVPVDAAPHHAEGTPAETHNLSKSDKMNLRHDLPFSQKKKKITLKIKPVLSRNTHSHNYTQQTCADIEPFFKNKNCSHYTRASMNYRVVACGTAVKAKLKLYFREPSRGGLLYKVYFWENEKDVRLDFLVQLQKGNMQKVSKNSVARDF